MRKLLIKPQGRVDMLDIWHHIARDSISAANRVSEKFDEAIRGLVEMPGKGHTRADVKDKNYRFWCVYSYVIAYRYDDAVLEIIRVVHGHRDLRRLFK